MSDRSRNWYGARRKRERVTVGLGYVYQLLRWLNMPRLARLLMRRPWHVADELRGGTWVRVMAYPKGMAEQQQADRLAELNKLAAKRAAELEKNPAAPPREKVTKKLGTIQLKPGMKMYQVKDGEVVEVQLQSAGSRRVKEANGSLAQVAQKRAEIDHRLPLVVALNEKNARRKLGLR